MDIEQLVINSLRKLTEEYELKREVLLSVLHLNIDALLNNAEQWFGGDVPAEYRDVIRSLMNLSSSFWKPSFNYDELLSDDESTEIDIAAFLSILINEFSTFPRSMRIEIRKKKEQYHVIIPSKTFKQSLVNIVLSLYPFMTAESSCIMTLDEEKSNITLEIRFLNLNDLYPGKMRIQRPIFQYQMGNAYRIGIGINSALYYLKNCGTQVKIDDPEGERSLCVMITFPTVDFMHMVDDMRKTEAMPDSDLKQGTILIFIDDLIMEMVTREILQARGYRVVKFPLSRLESGINYHEYKAIIVDYGYIIKYFINSAIFSGYIAGFDKIIILYGSEDEVLFEEIGDKKINLLKKPFGVDDIIKHIESVQGE